MRSGGGHFLRDRRRRRGSDGYVKIHRFCRSPVPLLVRVLDQRVARSRAHQGGERSWMRQRQGQRRENQRRKLEGHRMRPGGILRLQRIELHVGGHVHARRNGAHLGDNAEVVTGGPESPRRGPARETTPLLGLTGLALRREVRREEWLSAKRIPRFSRHGARSTTSARENVALGTVKSRAARALATLESALAAEDAAFL